MGLRERKKQRTRTLIADAALGLFLERGFSEVTVAEVAAAAEVSVNTVFNYFPTKEDLFFDRQADVEDRLARMVRERAPGESAVAAVRRALLEGIKRGEPTLGLAPDVAGFWHVIAASPALQARARLIAERSEGVLADTLATAVGAGQDDPEPRLVAAAIAGVDRAVHDEIRRRMLAGEPPEVVRGRARTAARKGFDLLTTGLAGYARREQSPPAR